MSYTTSHINKEWLIKVFGRIDGKKINTLVGVSGLINLIGEDMANKLICQAFDSLSCKYNRKLRRGIQVTFYAH